MRAKTYYMHTLGMYPAFYDGRQVCYARIGAYGRSQWLCSSIAEIREQWQKSETWRVRQGFGKSVDRHDYVRLDLPT